MDKLIEVIVGAIVCGGLLLWVWLICYGEEMEDGWRAIERELRKMDS